MRALYFRPERTIYIKMAVTAGVLALAVFALTHEYRCPFLYLLRTPCPGCGMTHAVRAFLSGKVGEAFRCHAMFWSLPLLYLYWLADFRLLSSKFADRAILAALLTGYAINYAVRVLL